MSQPSDDTSSSADGQDRGSAHASSGKSADLLGQIINHLGMKEAGPDDYRQTAGACPFCGAEATDNPHFSISRDKGAYCHMTGQTGSPLYLAKQLGLVTESARPKASQKRTGKPDTSAMAQRAWDAATSTDADWALILRYLATRGLIPTPEQEAALRAHSDLRVGRYKGVTSILYPVREIAEDGALGELVRKVGRVAIDEQTGEKLDKKQLGTIAEHDNAYRFDPFPDTPAAQKPVAVFEGLEDALTAWSHDSTTPRAYLVASSWTGIPKVAGFLAGHPPALSVVVCDADALYLPGGKPHLPSLRGALQLQAKVQGLHIRIPRMGEGVDANKAHQAGQYAAWKASLSVPTAEELEIAAAANAQGAERQAQQAERAALESGVSPAAALSEIAIAREFATKHTEVLCYTHATGGWRVWDAGHWDRDQSLVAFGMNVNHCEALSARLVDSIDSDLVKQAKAVATKRFILAVLDIARADTRIAMRPEQWDSDIWLFNHASGSTDLANAGITREHRRDDYCTKISPAAPDPGACPMWVRFLDQVTGGDTELQAFLQRMAGYCLTGSTREEVFFFMYGTGANGKSTFINTLKYVLGDYAATADMDLFTVGKHDPHPSSVAALRGARMVTAVETDQGQRWSEARIKALTGSDPVQAKMLYKEPFEFQPQCKLVIVGNHKPALRNVDEAMRRRMMLIPFTASIPPAERNPLLGDSLKNEAGGILAWAIDGCLAWQEDGLRPPRAVQDATDEYFEAEDKVGRWIEEECVCLTNVSTNSSSLYDSFKKWSDVNGEYCGSNRWFSGVLEDRGFEKQKGKTGRLFIGIGLKAVAEDGARF